MSFSKRYAKKQSKQQKSDQRDKKQAYRLALTEARTKNHTSLQWRVLLFSTLLLLCAATVAFVWHYRDQVLFPIKHIDVQGHFDRVKSENLQAVFAAHASGSLVLISPYHLTEALLQVPWVDQVSVQRVWPSTLRVVIEQKDPVARFGEIRLLSNHSVLFTPPDMKGTEDLPNIDGPENRANQLWQTYLAFEKILLPLDLHILRLEVSPRLSYSLVLNNGITVYLGSVDMMQRLALFARVYPKSLRPRLAQIEYVDMRYSSAMAVGWKAAVPSTNPPPAADLFNNAGIKRKQKI